MVMYTRLTQLALTARETVCCPGGGGGGGEVGVFLCYHVM